MDEFITIGLVGYSQHVIKKPHGELKEKYYRIFLTGDLKSDLEVLQVVIDEESNYYTKVSQTPLDKWGFFAELKEGYLLAIINNFDTRLIRSQSLYSDYIEEVEGVSKTTKEYLLWNENLKSLKSDVVNLFNEDKLFSNYVTYDKKFSLEELSLVFND